MSKIFFSQYINFEMNSIIVITDNLATNNNPNTKKVRFSGTPCTFLRKACGGLEWWVVVIVGGDGWW